MSRFKPVPILMSGYKPIMIFMSGFRPVTILMSRFKSVMILMSGFKPVTILMSGLRPVTILMSGFKPVTILMSGLRPVTILMSGFRPVPGYWYWCQGLDIYRQEYWCQGLNLQQFWGQWFRPVTTLLHLIQLAEHYAPGRRSWALLTHLLGTYFHIYGSVNIQQKKEIWPVHWVKV